MGDGAIQDHVRDALLQEPALARCGVRVREGAQLTTYREALPEPTGEIEVSVHDGVVTLDGYAPSLAQKRLAGVLAWWVPGSRDVINALAVEPPEEDTDAELTDAVRLVLEKDPFVNASQIRVSARNAIVTLTGLVPTTQMKDMAVWDAWYVFGVDRVIDSVEVEE